MNRRLILLDVDGVLNPTRRPSKQFELHSVEGGDQSYKVWLNPAHGPMLLELAEEVGADLVWATTWEHLANRSIGPLVGLPELPVMELKSPGTALVFNEKFASVPAFADGADWLWFEDVVFHKDSQWLRDQPGIGRFRVVQVAPASGLSDKHLKVARRWFAELPA